MLGHSAASLEGLHCAWTATSVPFHQFCELLQHQRGRLLCGAPPVSNALFCSGTHTCCSCTVAKFLMQAAVMALLLFLLLMTHRGRHPCTPENGAIAHGIKLYTISNSLQGLSQPKTFKQWHCTETCPR